VFLVAVKMVVLVGGDVTGLPIGMLLVGSNLITCCFLLVAVKICSLNRSHVFQMV